ncbi:MAG: DUF3024 domain-containing protein [Mycobacterium sp.]
MSAGGLPQLDVARVQRWCTNQVPEHMRGEIRVECDVAPRHLTICECRPPWLEDFGPDWTRFPIARQDTPRGAVGFTVGVPKRSFENLVSRLFRD